MSELDVYGDVSPEEAAEIRAREVKEFGEETVTAADAMDLKGALGTIGRVLRPVDPRDNFSILAFGAEAHLVSLLESVFYLAFKGPTGAGKGTGVEVAILLTPDGEVLGSTTEAYLATVLDEGKAIGIEEADKLIQKNPAIASLLRNGYRRGSFYGFKIHVEGKKWETARRDLFGPKAFDFHSTLESHLLGRTIVVMVRPENDVDLAMDAERKARFLAPVRLWLERLARRHTGKDARKYARKRVEALWDDPAFRARVKGLGGKTGRDHVLGANLLLICDLLGWDYEDEVRRLMASRKTLEEFSDEAEVVEEILTWWRENGGKGELPTLDLLGRINTVRESTKDPRRLTPHLLGTILRDVGFEKGRVSDPGATWVKATAGEDRDQWVLRPTPSLIEELAQMAQMAQSDGQSGSEIAPDALQAPLPIYGRGEDVDPRNFRRVPREDLRPGRCPRCGDLGDLTREDPNAKRFCEGCFEDMTGGAG